MATKTANLPSTIVIESNTSPISGAASTPRNIPASAGNSTSTITIARSCTISQPTVMRPRSVSTRRRSCRRRSKTTVLATDSATPKTSPAPSVQPSHRPTSDAERRRDQSLRQSAGNGDGADRQQIVEREMEPDAEHQQNDADLGELVGDVLVGDIAGRERPDQDAGEQIADQRRELEAMHQYAQGEGEHEADGEGGNERWHVRHEAELSA